MITGYARPLYLLPFDHRASYISGLFDWKEPLNVEQMVTVANSKQVIYAGFQQAIADQVPQDRVGILVDDGVEPDVWKVEELDRREDAVKMVEIARRGGCNSVSLIVLGRGAERERVVRWLKTAASVPGFIGFAVGRTSFWQPLIDFEAKRISQEEAATRIAHNFEAWMRIFEETRSA